MGCDRAQGHRKRSGRRDFAPASPCRIGSSRCWEKPVEPEEAGIPKARELVQLLQAEVLPFVDLVGVTRRADGWELVRVDVRPEVPTFPVNNIRMVEPIAVEFDPADRLETGRDHPTTGLPVCPAYLRRCAGRNP